jgi:WD40 repeat protein/serine/threonine protein kinase
LGQDDGIIPRAVLLTDTLLGEQSGCWRAGRPIRVEDFLERRPWLRDEPDSLLDLIVHEVSLRERAGESPEPEEYLSRFPWLADRLELQLEIQGLFRTALANEPSGEPPREGQPEAPSGFAIDEEIGRGGMGVVYRARQLALNRRVALKLVIAGQHADPARLARLRIEAEAVARLQHPNIVQIFEVGEHVGCPFLVLEYVEGSNLARVFAGAPQDPRRIAALMETLARAVHHVHQQGIIHRDLKPANILVTTDGIPKITDFGLAKILEGASARTESGAVLGTPSYMAPEQVSGKPGRVGPATDVYALGALLYEGMTGRPPFRAENPLDTFQQVVSDEVVPPSRLLQKTPRDLETIALKCLAKEPQRRYADAAALADDLNRFLADRPIVARPINRLELAGRWCRRNPALGAAIGLAVAALLGITIVSSLYSLSLSRNARQAGESAKSLGEALRTSEEHRRHSELGLAEAYLDRGRTLGDRGSGAEALLVLARALEIAPQSETSLQHAIRTHIGSFADKLHRPSMVLDTGGQVTALETSPDGTKLAAGRMDGAIVLWSAQTGARTLELRHHPSRIQALAFSPDGHTLCSGADDGTARLWHLTDHSRSATVLHHGGHLRRVTFSPDGSRILTGAADGTVKLWSVLTGRPTDVFVTHPGGIQRGAQFDPEGNVFMTCGGGDSARLWNAATGQPLGAPLQHRHWVGSAAFSPDGRFVLTGSVDATARLWERASGKPVGVPCQHASSINALVFSPTGERFATVSHDATARIWDTATTQPITKPLPHELPVQAVAFSPDGATLATGSDDQTVRLWEVRSGRPIGLPLRHTGQIWGVKFTPDGQLLTWGLDDPVRLWRLAEDSSPSRTLRHATPVTAVAYSPKERVVVTGTVSTPTSRGQVQRWDATTHRPIGVAIPQPDGVSSLTVSPDGSRIACGIAGFEFGEARIWDAASGELVGGPFRHAKSVRAVCFTRDGVGLFTSSDDRTVRLWNVTTGEQIRVYPHEDYVTSVAVAPDGKSLLTGSEDRLVLFWDVETARVVGQPFRHQGAVTGVALSPDGRIALTACVDHTAQFWDTNTRRPIGKPLRHSEWVSAVAFSPNGLMAITASADATLQLWDTRTQRPIGMPLRHESAVFAAAFSPDGKTVLSGSMDASAQFWPVPAPVEGTIERIAVWAQVVTGAALGESDVVRVLDAPTWQRRRRRLEELGSGPAAVAAKTDRSR